MKQKLLKFLPLIIAAVLCVTLLVVLLVTCGKGNKVTEIYVLGSNEPRLSYVEGQDLDLSGGILTVVIKGEELKVPLTSEDITVTGYDKNKTGNQEITIHHGDLTTTLTVNVLPRVIVENYELNYFIGDSFNKDMGKIKIANDNANGYTTVNMNDSRVSVVNFDSGKEGISTVTVNCTVNGVTYPCSFNVNFYSHSNVTFVPPGITTYYSHDTSGLNVAKGNFTVTSSDSKLTKNVKLSVDMVSGFDLSVATFEDRNTPITQTLTVTYLDKTFTYDITIYYSEVSAIEYLTKNYLNGINWTSELTLTADQQAAALDAINAYYQLDKTDRALISSATRNTLARAGAVAVNTLYMEEFNSYSATFKMQSETSANLVFTADDYEKVALDAARLADPDSKLSELTALLRKIEDDFSDVELANGKDISEYIIVFDSKSEEFIISTINHLVDIYTPLKDIPVDWTLADLTAYGDAIVSSAVKISNATHYRDGRASYYNDVVSKWREKDDFFEIIYSYLLYTHEDGASFIATTMVGKAPMISALDDWYNVLQTLVNTEINFKDYKTTTYALADLSSLMYYYFLTFELADKVKTEGTQLEKDLYEAIDGDLRNRVNAYTHSYGYLYHAKGLIDCDTYVELWETYYQVIKLYNNKKLDATEHKDLIVKMADLFQDFTPTELYGFLCTLNNAYELVDHDNNPETLYILVFGEEMNDHANIFAFILNTYYSKYLNEASRPIFEKLLLAMESYALIDYRSTALDEFKSHMAEVVAAYNELNETDRAEFDAMLGKGYNKYLGIYNLATGNTTFTPTDAEAELLARLEDSIQRYYEVYMFMGTLSDIPDGFYGMLFSFFAESIRCYEQILASDNAAFISYFFEKECVITGSGWTLTCTLESAYAKVDKMTTTTLNDRTASLSTNDDKLIYVTAWDLFRDYEIFDLIADMSDLLWFDFVTNAPVTDSYVSDIMQDLWALTDFQRSLITYLSLDGPYYDALTVYFAEHEGLSDLGKIIADMLLEAEVETLSFSNEDNKDNFKNLMELIIADYDDLEDNDKALLNALYEKCLEIYNEINA